MSADPVRRGRPPTGEDTCRRKLSFATERDALRELANIIRRAMLGDRARYATGHLERGAYECPGCGGWHLSSQAVEGQPISRPLARRA